MATHLLKYTEWQGAKDWYCTDASDFKHGSANWWLPARMLNISPADFILLLVNEYNARICGYDKSRNVLLYSFDDYASVHKFVLFINREARKRNYMIKG